MMASPAAEASAAIARMHGISFDAAHVIGGHANTLVQLRPLPLIARVATGIARVRSGAAWLAREIAVAGQLALAGAPAVRPSRLLPPGPHQHGGLVLSYWELAERTSVDVSPEDAGRTLRRCHDALADARLDFPHFAPIEESRRLLAHPRVIAAYDEPRRALLVAAVDRVDAQLERLPLRLRPVHGDAHPGNVWATAAGPIWGDWEDTFIGPVEWDLASLVGASRLLGDGSYAAAALGAYGGSIDHALLELMLEARSVQSLVWAAILSDDPLAIDRVRVRLVWLVRRS